MAAASVVSLCFGAYLSYEAATTQDGGQEIVQQTALAETGAPVQDSSQVTVALEPAAAAPEVSDGPVASAPQMSVLASAEAPSRLVFAPADSAASGMELRGAESAEPATAFTPPPENVARAPSAPGSEFMPAPLPDFPVMPDRAAPPRPQSRPVVASLAPARPGAPAEQPVEAPQQSSTGAFPGISNALQAMAASFGGDGGMGESPSASPVPPGLFRKGAPVFVRIFKQEGELELWMKNGDSYSLARTFHVCKWSGKLGPKLQRADYQSPEGFYSVSARQLNPHSAYHLAFDIGYPNAYDRRHGATGNAIMVHGDCKSVGCFAMTNRGIEEIYGYVHTALAAGQREVPVHIFPFRMTEAAIARESSGPILAFLGDGAPHRDWSPFWRNLKEGYDQFERTHVPPVAYACGDRYEFGAGGKSCARIAGR